MRSATLFIFLSLLTPGWASAGVQSTAPEIGSVLRASDSAIESLERLHARAESQIVRNDFQGAVRTYSDILLIEPDDETAYAGLGNCYLVLGQYKKANQAYRNALSINPGNETAILGIQKIMDPDGLEGMVHPAQIQTEEESAVFRRLVETQTETPAAKPAILPGARPARALLPIPIRTAVTRLGRLSPESVALPPPAPQPAPAQAFKPAPIVIEPVKRLEIETLKGLDSVDAFSIQKALRNTGFYSGPIDGLLGPVSRKAIKEYQILHALAADGVVGPKTWATLRLYLDPEE